MTPPFRHVHFVADRADLADSHGSMTDGVDQKSGGQHAALNDQRDISGLESVIPNRWGYKGKYMALDSIHQFHAVGPPQPDTGFSEKSFAA